MCGFSGWCSGKESASQYRGLRIDPWVGKIPWRREGHPSPVFLPGESHEQRSLAGCSPWGHKESGTTEHTRTHIKLLCEVGLKMSFVWEHRHRTRLKVEDGCDWNHGERSPRKYLSFKMTAYWQCFVFLTHTFCILVCFAWFALILWLVVICSWWPVSLPGFAKMAVWPVTRAHSQSRKCALLKRQSQQPLVRCLPSVSNGSGPPRSPLPVKTVVWRPRSCLKTAYHLTEGVRSKGRERWDQQKNALTATVF